MVLFGDLVEDGDYLGGVGDSGREGKGGDGLVTLERGVEVLIGGAWVWIGGGVAVVGFGGDKEFFAG